MPEPLFVWIIGGVICYVGILSIQLSSTYFKQWVDASRVRMGYSKEEWEEDSGFPPIPNIGIAAILSLFILLYTVVIVSVLLGPCILCMIASYELIMHGLARAHQEVTTWDLAIPFIVGMLLTHLTVGKLAKSVIRSIEAAIATPDDERESQND